MDKNKVTAIISGIILGICVPILITLLDACPPSYYNINVDKYYQQYNDTKEITDEKKLIEALEKLSIDYHLEHDTISTKYLVYKTGDKVELQPNDLTQLFEIYTTRNINNENFELYTEDGVLFINKIMDENIKGEKNDENIKSGICLKNGKLYYREAYKNDLSSFEKFVSGFFVCTVILFLIFLYNLMEILF